MSLAASKHASQDPFDDSQGGSVPSLVSRTSERVPKPPSLGGSACRSSQELKVADKYFFQELSKSAGSEVGMKWLHERVVKNESCAGGSCADLSDCESSEEEDKEVEGNLMSGVFVEKFRNNQSAHLEPTCVYALLNEGYESLASKIWAWLMVALAFLGWFSAKEEVEVEETEVMRKVEAKADHEETKSQVSEEEGINRSSSTEGESSQHTRPRVRKASSLGRILKMVDKDKKGLIYTDAAHLLMD
eukprot:753465-Hanusia_phi.AAC.3